MGAQRLAWDITSPEVDLAITTLQKAGREMRKWQAKIDRFNRMIDDAGFPQYFQGAAMPPFDIISHSMRGMAGTMQDMFRQPDKLIRGCEKVLELDAGEAPAPSPRPSAISACS